ncbi:uncharacterized protein LOC116166258 [Photinus pyralis]|uniref:uncharacterized protein LOC116163057 n=1 Tax=Photinus pyralis TaxID=7054 RepID=UPI00126726FB|nr:uncharacterized protein LOC116163057 [Photinus pyralis]XP_031336992.1 uncharacterized protein LOC116166258 [Photinus pyralis]
MKCNRCEEVMNVEEVLCYGCEGSYHYACSISERTLRARSKADRQSWRCQYCRDKNKPSKSSQESISSDLGTGFSSQLDQLSGDINPTLKQFMEQVVSSLQFMSNKMEELSSSMNSIAKENKELKDEIKTLNQHMETKDKQIETLTARVTKLEQYKKRKFIEIHGVDGDKSTSPEDKFKIISEKIGCEGIPYKTVDLINLKSSNILLVKLHTVENKEKFIKMGKMWWRNFSEEERKTTKRLYFNEHLTPENRLLFRETRKKSAALGYKYTWIKNGRILIKKDDSAKVLSVNSVKDVEKLI